MNIEAPSNGIYILLGEINLLLANLKRYNNKYHSSSHSNYVRRRRRRRRKNRNHFFFLKNKNEKRSIRPIRSRATSTSSSCRSTTTRT